MANHNNYNNNNENILININNSVNNISTTPITSTSTITNNSSEDSNLNKLNKNLSGTVNEIAEKNKLSKPQINSNDSTCLLLNNSNSTDHCDMTSLEILNKCHLDLFPKKDIVCDDVNCMSIVEQLPILNGEYIQFIGPSGKLNDDILLITNYRLFLLIHNGTSFINVPIMLIEWTEIKENIFLYVYLKNAKTVRITFGTNEKASLWYQRLHSIISKTYKLDELFAFTFYSWLTNEKLDDSNENMKCFFSKNTQTNLIKQEFKRMKFDPNIWRLSDANKKFELCPTYPESFIIPNCMSDEQMKKIASFRSSKRFPTVVWRSKVNGAVIARSSQPNVGLLAWRLNEDELLIKAIADCCAYNTSNNSNISNKNQISNNSTQLNSGNHINGNSFNMTSNSNINGSNDSNKSCLQNVPNGQTSIIDQLTQVQSSMLLIIDARFRTVALANRVKGGGYEYSEYYTNCEIQFMNIENIHVIRSSFQSLRLLCQSINDNKTLLSQLENTKWLHHLSGIIKAACTVISAIDQYAKPVLIHCSDGWDRTPQILALSKLLLDPYYRTINGFRTLIEIDWLLFGHKFAQRNGHIANYSDVNERCPVFLQWLDCVYQISRQFPSAFQFNETYLLKLCYHSYSCLFGNFLCDSLVERVNEHTDERTFSIWSYLNDKNIEIINHLYDDQLDEVLYPKFELVNMQLWQKLFCESELKHLVKLDRNEIQNFNDSIDAGIFGSSPSFEQLHKQVDMSNEDLNNSKMTTSTSVSSSTSRINNLIKNAIDSSSYIANSSLNSNGANLNNSLKPSSLNQISRTRSFDELTRFPKITSKKDSLESKELCDKSHLNNSLSTEDMNSIENNGDPIQTRSCSESNLLLDALQNIASTSPKFLNGNNRIKSYNENKSSNQNDTEYLLSENEAMTKSSLAEKNIKVNEHNNSDLLSTNDNKNSESTLTIKATTQNGTPSSSLINSNNSLLLMQNSTETLVEEALLKTGMLNSSMLKNTLELQNKQREPLVINTSSNANTGQSVNNGTSSANSSESSTSTSTLPSPTLSTTNLKNLLSQNNEFSTCAHQNNSQNRILKSMSTSTSGLSDFVESSKFRYLNDTIKYFEKNFNTNCDLINGINNIGNEYLSSLNNHNSDFFINEFSNFKLSSKENDITNLNLSNRNNNNYRLESYNNLTNIKKSDCIDSNRKTSNSIPIVKKNKEKRIEIKKPNKKSIQDCIDIDGLTKIEDISCRKIVARDEQYKKEIAILKDQVNKCKWFFNKLVHNPVWQDCPNDYGTVEISENVQSDENQSNSFSFSNDSVCSSWDEIDESDYKAASWVPDYYVTHCQNCNEKFSYSLRKHHCRNCGQVFCYKCADQFYPLPNHNLTAPVRICHSCKSSIDKEISSNKKNFSNTNNNANNKNQIQKQQQSQISNFNSSTLIFSSTPPNFNSDFFSSNFKFDKLNQSVISNSTNNGDANCLNPTKLLNPINLQKSSNNSHQISYSTSPTCPLSSTYPSSINQFNLTKNASNLMSSTNTTTTTTTSSSNCNINIGSRCNQMESNKFKKNGNKTQKVSV